MPKKLCQKRLTVTRLVSGLLLVEQPLGEAEAVLRQAPDPSAAGTPACSARRVLALCVVRAADQTNVSRGLAISSITIAVGIDLSSSSRCSSRRPSASCSGRRRAKRSRRSACAKWRAASRPASPATDGRAHFGSECLSVARDFARVRLCIFPLRLPRLNHRRRGRRSPHRCP